MKDLRKLVEWDNRFLYNVIEAIYSNYSKDHLPVKLKIKGENEEKIVQVSLNDSEMYKASRWGRCNCDIRVTNFVEGDWVDSLLKLYSKIKDSRDMIDYWVDGARKKGVDVEAYGFRIETLSLSETSKAITNFHDNFFEVSKKYTRNDNINPEISDNVKITYFSAICESYNILVPGENLEERLDIIYKELKIHDKEFFKKYFRYGWALKPSMY